MKIVSIVILHSSSSTSQDARIVNVAYELSTIGYFQRGTMKEFVNFFTKTIADRTRIGERKSVTEQDNIIHVFKRSDGLTGCIVSDAEYSPRVAFTIINKVLDEFSARYGGVVNKARMEDMPFSDLDKYILEYQDPAKADKLTALQKDLDETKEILNTTIEAVLARGEALDNLVERSEELSGNSKLFYKQAKKTNACCSMM